MQVRAFWGFCKGFDNVSAKLGVHMFSQGFSPTTNFNHIPNSFTSAQPLLQGWAQHRAV